MYTHLNPGRKSYYPKSDLCLKKAVDLANTGKHPMGRYTDFSFYHTNYPDKQTLRTQLAIAHKTKGFM